MKTKHFLMAGAMAAALSGTGIAMADTEQEACMAELCLGVIADPIHGFNEKLPIQCADNEGIKGVHKYFEIKRFSKGKFNAGSTYREREKFLNKCESENTRTKKLIMAKFGNVPEMPRGLIGNQ